MSRLERWTCRVVVFNFPDSPAPETLHALTPNAALFGIAGRLPPMNPAGRHSSAPVFARCPLPHDDLSCVLSAQSCLGACLEAWTTWGLVVAGSYLHEQQSGNPFVSRHVNATCPPPPQKSSQRRWNSTRPTSINSANDHLCLPLNILISTAQLLL